MFGWFNDLSIRIKLLGSFAAVIALMGVAVFFGIQAVISANNSTGDVFNNQMKVYADVAAIDGSASDSTVAAKSALLASEKTQADQLAAESQASLDKAIAGLAAVKGQFQTPETQALAATMEKDLADLKKARGDVFATLKSQGSDAAQEVNAKGFTCGPVAAPLVSCSRPPTSA
jgi:CHASE3 domain sensor protein